MAKAKKDSNKERKSNSVSIELVKDAYLTEGLDAESICARFGIDPEEAFDIISENKLPELRKHYISKGLQKIQSGQVNQSQRLLDLENKFNQLKLVQLEQKLENFLAYYAKHGDLYARDVVSGKVLLDTNDMPIQIDIPSVVKEIKSIKESINLSEGIKSLLVSIDDIIQPPMKDVGNKPTETIVDLSEDIDGLFQHGSE